MSEAPALAHDSLLYLDGVTVSFDGFRALNGLSLVLYVPSSAPTGPARPR